MAPEPALWRLVTRESEQQIAQTSVNNQKSINEKENQSSKEPPPTNQNVVNQKIDNFRHIPTINGIQEEAKQEVLAN